MPTAVKTRNTAVQRDENGRFVAKKSTARKKTAGVAGTDDRYMLWKDIQKQYPAHHILLENPVFCKDHSQVIEKGILLCASKKRDDITKEIKKYNRPLKFLIDYIPGSEKRYIIV